MHFEACIDLRGDDTIHLVCAVPVHKRTEGVILLERISFATKRHPTHLPAKTVDQCITVALAVQV